MLRIFIGAVLFLGAVMAHADDGIEKYLGEYTAMTVCDSHMSTPDVQPHIRENGKFTIERFVNEEGEHRAIVVGKPNFSSYDWSEVEFEYHPGREYRDIQINCPDVAGGNLRADLETRRYIYDGRLLTVREITNFSNFLKEEGERDGGGREHLRAEYHFHEKRNCLRDENGKDLESGCHVIKIYTSCDDSLLIEYQAVGDGIHAGHVHN